MYIYKNVYIYICTYIYIYIYTYIYIYRWVEVTQRFLLDLEVLKSTIKRFTSNKLNKQIIQRMPFRNPNLSLHFRECPQVDDGFSPPHKLTMKRQLNSNPSGGTVHWNESNSYVYIQIQINMYIPM